MNNSYLNSGLELLVSCYAVLVFCIIIILFSLCHCRKYLITVNEIIKRFQDAKQDVESEEFDEIAEKFSNADNQVFKAEWDNFSNNRNLKKVISKNTQNECDFFVLEPPSTFFNEESIILRQCNMEWYSSVPSILTGLGLLFTFAGLAAGIYLGLDGLDLQGENFDVAEMTGTLKNLLSGASLAFVTSIVGLFSALIFQSIVKTKKHKLFEVIAEFNQSLEKAIPLKTNVQLQYETNEALLKNGEMLREFNSDWQNLLKDQFQVIAENISNGFNNMSNNQAGQIASVMTEAMNSFSDGLADRMQELNDSLQDSAEQIKDASKQMETMLVVMKDSAIETGNTLSEQVQSTKGHMQEITDNVRLLSEELENKIENVSLTVKHLAEKIQSTGDNFEKNLSECSKDTTASVAKISSILTQQEEQLLEFNSILTRFNSNNFESMTTMISDVLEQQNSTLNLTKSHYNMLKEQGEVFETSMQKQRDSMNSILADNFSYLGESLDKMHDTLRKNIVQADSAFSDALNMLSNTLQEYAKQQDIINKDWQNQINNNMKLLNETNKTLSKK